MLRLGWNPRRCGITARKPVTELTLILGISRPGSLFVCGVLSPAGVLSVMP
jgi:hypothetical protein